MKGLYTEVHDEVEIVIIDYSMVSHENQFELMKLSLDYIKEYEPSSALVLEIITKVKLKEEILEYFPTYFESIKGHVSKWASVGFGKLIFKEMVAAKRIDASAINSKRIDWFESREEAMQFLMS
ncbi:hypothetical protein [Ekhidna sp.]|uniref:hypothetical protein n=1 Tax=Ekhidna sp. TaxID=2608089 RepID=UPI003B501456